MRPIIVLAGVIGFLFTMALFAITGCSSLEKTARVVTNLSKDPDKQELADLKRLKDQEHERRRNNEEIIKAMVYRLDILAIDTRATKTASVTMEEDVRILKNLLADLVRESNKQTLEFERRLGEVEERVSRLEKRVHKKRG